MRMPGSSIDIYTRTPFETNPLCRGNECYTYLLILDFSSDSALMAGVISSGEVLLFLHSFA